MQRVDSRLWCNVEISGKKPILVMAGCGRLWWEQGFSIVRAGIPIVDSEVSFASVASFLADSRVVEQSDAIFTTSC